MNAKKKILIIEDEKSLAHALELKLTREGFVVSIAPDGELGLDAVAKEKFDLIICDLVMPKMDGFQVLKELKAKKIHTPVIVLTNLSQTEDEKKVKELGAVDFFIKSNTPIANIVERVVKFFK